MREFPFNKVSSSTVAIQLVIQCMQLLYRIRGNFRGMKFSLNRKQTGFSRLYFRGSQVHRGKVACYVLLQISNSCKLANFHGLNFCCISRWPWNPRNLHTAKIYAHTVSLWPSSNSTSDKQKIQKIDVINSVMTTYWNIIHKPWLFIRVY